MWRRTSSGSACQGEGAEMDTSYLDWMLDQEDAGPMAEPADGLVIGALEGGIWVVADAESARVAAVSFEALTMARSLADALGAYVHGVLLGEGIRNLTTDLYQAGADRVWVADHPMLASFDLAPYLETLAGLLEKARPEVVVFGSTVQGRALAPRLAQRMEGGLIEHVIAVELDESIRAVLATVPVYGGEYYDVIVCPEARAQLLTLETGAFPAPFLDPNRRGEPEDFEVIGAQLAVQVLGPAEGFEPATVPLDHASVVVAGGRQVGDFELVRELAAALGGQVAGDRGARDAGWVGRDRVVDVRGVRIRPKVYVAVGIRGDSFHNAAVQEAGFVLAIHPDPGAPVFQVADLCLEADPRTVVPAILEALG